MSIEIHSGQTAVSMSVLPGETILDVLRRGGFEGVHTPCGGKGTCLKCVVWVTSPGRCGAMLACRTPAEDGMTVELKPEVRVAVTESGSCRVLPPDPGQSGYAAACDIGTTTVVCHLLSLATGRRLATVSGGNRQRMLGADVIARIQACSEGKRPWLTETIVEQINEYLAALCQKAGVSLSELSYLAVAGNTVMEHLASGLSPESIGVSPFTPLSLFGEELSARGLGFAFSGKVYFAPAVAGYVGGDITSDALATGLLHQEKPVLMIDVGTNGEMMLGCRDGIVCCATAAGPAFEGAQIKYGMTASDGAVSAVAYENGALSLTVLGNVPPVGLCGSGLIDAAAVMLTLGAVDETGRIMDAGEAPAEALPFLGETEEDGRVFYLTEDRSICVTQKDLRSLQLAKAAIAAGAEILAKEYGVPLEQVSSLLLAGGFGSFIRPESAGRIGLIPPALLPVTRAVGNAAGEGAVSAALSSGARRELSEIRAASRYLELSRHPGFNDCYLNAMMFEEENE